MEARCIRVLLLLAAGCRCLEVRGGWSLARGRPRKAIDPERLAVALDLYTTGEETIASLSRKLELSQPVIRRSLEEAEAGLVPRSRMAYQMAMSDEVASAVIEGHSLTRVAHQLNVSRGVIRKLMAANESLAEVVMRARADKPRKRAARAGLSQHDLMTMASLYDQGDTTASLAQTFNMSVRSVVGFLRDAGADVRRRPGIAQLKGPQRAEWAGTVATGLREGRPMSSLADELNVSVSAIRYLIQTNASLTALLDKARAAERERRAAVRETRASFLLNGARKGITVADVAAELEIGDTVLRNQLLRDKSLAAELEKARSSRRRQQKAFAFRMGQQLTAEVEEAKEALDRQAQEALRVLSVKEEERRARQWESGARSSKARELDVEFVDLRRSGLTLQEIGARYGVSRERVRQRLQRCNLTGRPPTYPDVLELEALACIYAATPAPLCGDDGSAAMTAACEAAEAHGLDASGVESRLRTTSSAIKRRRHFLELSQNASIASGVARGESLGTIATRVGATWPALYGRLEGLALHRRRRRRRRSQSA